MTSSGCNVHQLGLDIDRNHSECLNHVDYQQSVISASGAPDSLEVGAKARRVLDLADGHDSCSVVDQPNKLIDINATVALLTNTHFHSQRISKAQRGIKVWRKLMTKSDQVVAGLPAETIGDGGKGVGSVSH